MDRFKKPILASILAVSLAISSFLLIEGVFASSKPPEPGFPHVKRVSDTSLQISWDKAPGASGYEVYRYSAAKGKYVRVRAVNRSNATRWTDKRLATGKKYSYKVRAWSRVHDRSVKKTRQYSALTYAVSAVPYRRDAAKVNAGAVISGTKSMTIGLSQKLGIKASVAPGKYGTSNNKTVIDRKIRVFVANKSLVRNSGGRFITGKGVGRAYVYALAHNGNIGKKIAVNVVDYAKPKSWYWHGSNIIDTSVGKLFSTDYDDFTDMVSWLAQHNQRQGELSLGKSGGIINKGLDKNGEITDIGGVNISGQERLIKRALSLFPPGAMYVSVQKKVIMADVWDRGCRFFILYNMQDELTESPDDSIYGDGIKIAPHWAFSMFVPV